ncbi:MAG: hypothetical protein V1667_02455 [bacterium]
MREKLFNDAVRQENMTLNAIFLDLSDKIKPKAQALAENEGIQFSDAFIQVFAEYLDKNFMTDVEALEKQKNISREAAALLIMERNGHLNLIAEKQPLTNI